MSVGRMTTPEILHDYPLFGQAYRNAMDIVRAEGDTTNALALQDCLDEMREQFVLLVRSRRELVQDRDELRDLMHTFVEKWDDYMGVEL